MNKCTFSIIIISILKAGIVVTIIVIFSPNPPDVTISPYVVVEVVLTIKINQTDWTTKPLTLWHPSGSKGSSHVLDSLLVSLQQIP